MGVTNQHHHNPLFNRYNYHDVATTEITRRGIKFHEVDVSNNPLHTTYYTHTVMWYSSALEYIRTGTIELVKSARCGDSRVSAVPTLLWTAGSAALAHHLVSALFRRFLFRRVPLWEITLQHLLFIWMVIYSVHFWTIVVQIMKFLVKYLLVYEIENSMPSVEELESEKLMQQWMIWLCAALPLAAYFYLRPKPVAPPLVIWITTSPWQRREMGAYGYYLNRPLPSLHSPTPSLQERALALRRAFSDSSKVVITEPINLKKRKINSKSV